MGGVREKGLSRLVNKIFTLQKYHQFQKQLVRTRENYLQINQKILDFKISVTGKSELKSLYCTDVFQKRKKKNLLLSQCQNKYLYVQADIVEVYTHLQPETKNFLKLETICWPNCNIHKNIGWREKCWFHLFLFPQTEPVFWVQINWNKRITSIFRQNQACVWMLLFFLHILILIYKHLKSVE